LCRLQFFLRSDGLEKVRQPHVLFGLWTRLFPEGLLRLLISLRHQSLTLEVRQRPMGQSAGALLDQSGGNRKFVVVDQGLVNLLRDFFIGPGVLLFLAALCAGYFAGIGSLRRRYQLGEPATRRQITCFVGFIALLFVTLVSPLDALGRFGALEHPASTKSAAPTSVASENPLISP